MVAADEENIEKAPERHPSPRGTWEEMVKHRRINSKNPSPSQSSSQESQEATDLGPSQAMRGRGSQKQQREHEVEREMELGRQLNIKDTRLLQNVKPYGTKDFRSRAGSHTSKK